MRKKLVPLAFSGLVLAIAISVAYYSRVTVYYPIVVIDAPSNLTLTFLQEAFEDNRACEGTAATIASLIKANCVACAVTQQQCLTDLPRNLGKLLTEEPLPFPSARMPRGIVTYRAADPEIALAACTQSQQSAGSVGPENQVTCYMPQTARPLQSRQAQVSEAARSTLRYLAQAMAILAAGYALFLTARAFTVRSPMDTGTGIPFPEEAEIKLSNLIKRFADIAIAMLLLFLLFPVLVLIALLILVIEGPPIFYVSKRFISVDRCVSILKFRTMVRDATAPKYRLKERFMRDGFLDIPLSCEVYTPIGRLLERTQLVEVLQIFNVIFHGISLVGNRPLPLDNIELLKKFRGWKGRFDSPAGITGISQIVGKFNQKPQERLQLECLYSEVYQSRSGNILRCDFLILLYTVRVLLFGKYLSVDEAKQLLANASGNTRL